MVRVEVSRRPWHAARLLPASCVRIPIFLLLFAAVLGPRISVAQSAHSQSAKSVKATAKETWLTTQAASATTSFLSAVSTSPGQAIADRPVAVGVSAPLRELAKLPDTLYGQREVKPIRPISKPNTSQGLSVDPVEQSTISSPPGYSVGLDFLGLGAGFPGSRVPFPSSDTGLAVGDTQIVEWARPSYFVFDKKGNPQIRGIPASVVWSSLGGVCANPGSNTNDTTVEFDRASHRWILAQNVLNYPYAVCIAVSTTEDATGTYYLYQFPVVKSGLPDYAKWGIWSTGYFQTWNNFGPEGNSFEGPILCGYNSAKLLAGDRTAERICHQYSSSEDSLLPADQDSPEPAPTGQDEFAIGSVGNVDSSHLSLYSMHVNSWETGDAVFTGDNNSQLVTVASFSPACSGAYGACGPQNGTSAKLVSVGDRLTSRFVYYNDRAQQHWYSNLDVTASGGQSGVRWMEFIAPNRTVPPTALSVAQQGTFAPDSSYRWMSSIARDAAGDILLGYSKSNDNMAPSVSIAGRTPVDAPGTLENEVPVMGGAGSPPRLGKTSRAQSALRIDPADNCTFWSYTNEYYAADSSADWSTGIASAKFPNCLKLDTQISVASGGSIPGGTASFTADGKFDNPEPSTLFYGGDFDPNNPNANGLSNETDLTVQGSPYGAATYQNFINSEAWNVTGLFTNNLSTLAPATAYWEIRTGVSEGNGGTLIASGIGSGANFSQTPTGRSGFGFIEYHDEVDGVGVCLAPGQYWFAVVPQDPNNPGRSFNGNTFGLNGIGTQDLDKQFHNSSFFGMNFINADMEGVFPSFSSGVIGQPTSGCGIVPSFTVLALTNGTNPSTYGDLLTFTATVSGDVGDPTGTVTFTDNGTAIPGCIAVPLMQGDGNSSAMCQIATLSAGHHTIKATYSGDSNYGSSVSLPFDQFVNQANPVVTVTPYTLTYDANPHTATGTATCAGIDLSGGLNLSGTTHTNAGDYPTDPWTFHDPNNNCKDANGTVHDVISQASAAITVTPYSVTFDGNPHTATGTATCAGIVVSGDLNLSGTTHTNAGDYPTDPWTFHDPNNNCNDKNGTVDDKISKVDPVITVTPYNVPYDAQPHTATVTTATCGGMNVKMDVDVSGTTHTNAGDYPTDPWTFHDPNNNCKDATGTVHDVISQANAAITVTPYTVTYDGNPHTATGTATCNGIVVSGDLNLSGTTHTNAGDYPTDPWTFHDPNNNCKDANGTVHDVIIASGSAPTCTLSVQGAEPSDFITQFTVNAIAACTDPQNEALTVSIAWGDGSVGTVSGDSLNLTHTYKAPPFVQQIVVTATDTPSKLQGQVASWITLVPASQVPALFAGQSEQFTANVVSTTTASVTFMCTTVIDSNGMVHQASDYSIECSSIPSPVTLIGQPDPQPVTLVITTIGRSGIAGLGRQHRTWLYALWLPLTGLLSLGFGTWGSRRVDIYRYIGLIGLVGLLLLLTFCGGGFTPPSQPPPPHATPAGCIQLTVVGTSTTSGFVQISLIVPLCVSPSQP